MGRSGNIFETGIHNLCCEFLRHTKYELQRRGRYSQPTGSPNHLDGTGTMMTDDHSEIEPRGRGRPTKYDAEKATAVLVGFMERGHVGAACNAAGVKPSTFRNWVYDDREGLAERYMRAKQVRAMVLLDECLEIADDSRLDWIAGPNGPIFSHEHLRRCEARINHRVFLANKLLPPGLGGALVSGYRASIEIRVVE